MGHIWEALSPHPFRDCKLLQHWCLRLNNNFLTDMGLKFGSRYLRRTSHAKKRRQNDRNRLNRRSGVMTAGALRLGLNLRTDVFGFFGILIAFYEIDFHLLSLSPLMSWDNSPKMFGSCSDPSC